MKYPIKAIQYSKNDLSHYTFQELRIITRYLDIPVTLSKTDMEWVIAIELLNKSYKSGKMPPKKRRIEWEKGIGMEQKDIPHPVKKTVYDVPEAEPEARAGLGGIEWPKLIYSTAARTCLRRVMGRYDIWDIEDLEELLDNPEKIIKKGITIIQLKRLQSCLRILKDEANPDDVKLIMTYSKAVGILRKRRRGPPPKIEAEDDTNSS